MRQLESMIRLSEAMARMEISDEVQPKHVKEAFRLLNKSIIRVEQPDIHLDEEGDEPLLDEAQNTEQDTAPESMDVTAKKKLVLSFEEYKTLSNMIVVHMRRLEIRIEEGSEEGIRRSGVVEWYLNHIAETIETEDELMEKKELVEKVIDRLIYHVSLYFFLL